MKLNITILLLFICVTRAFAQEIIGPHGYLTFEAEISNRDSLAENGTFDLHHFNIFANFLLNSKARVFGELEWEHGTDLSSDQQVDTYDSETTAGSLRLERAWFEYAFSQKFKLRIGKDLTPYGIYNEIHDATPAYDTSILPYSIYGKHRNNLGAFYRNYAKFTMGFAIVGQFESRHLVFDYKIFTGNGRGKNQFEQDDNKDKSIGFRGLLDLSDRGLKLGYSFYSDQNGLTLNARHTSFAFDVRYEKKRWRLTGEYAHSHQAAINDIAARLTANGYYGEIACLLYNHQTVLMRYDIYNSNKTRGNDAVRDLTFATNFQILKSSLVKAEVHLINDELALRQKYTLAIASLAIVF